MTDRLDRDAVARVLRRAQDLQEAHGGQDDAGLSADALIEAASEVGIDPDAVRDSLAIEAMSVEPAAPRRLDGIAGPTSVLVEREIGRPAPDVVEAIEGWLETGHRLRVDQPTERTLRATRRSDATASIGRFVSGLRGEGRLGVVRMMVVEVVPLSTGSGRSGGRSLVRVEAQRDATRRGRLGGGAAVGAAGLAGGIAAGTEIALVAGPAVAVPLVAGGFLVARTGRAHADRLALEVERLLSAVERGAQPARLLDRAVARMGRRSRSSVRG